MRHNGVFISRARCLPLDEIVAIKRCNLNCLECELVHLMEEAVLMASYKHPNILPLLCSFVDGENLNIVSPYMAVGVGPTTQNQFLRCFCRAGSPPI